MGLIRSRRSLHARLNALGTALAASLVLVFSLVLVASLGFRMDISAEGLSRLEPETVEVLDELTSAGLSVEITGFSRRVKHRERDRTMDAFLQALNRSSTHIQAALIKMDSDRIQALRLGVERYGTVVLQGNGRRVDLLEDELFLGDRSFAGEASIRRALRQLMAKELPRVSFIHTGSGAYHELSGVLSELGWTVDLPSAQALNTVNELPDLLIVIADGRVEPPGLASLISRQLDSTGALWFAAEPGSTGWAMVRDLGVTSPPGWVYDSRYVVPFPEQPHLEVLPHALSAGLTEKQQSPRVSTAGALAVQPVPGVVWTEVLRSSRDGWVEQFGGGKPRFDQGVDEQGPVTVAAVVNRRGQTKGEESRAFVISDVDVFADKYMGRSSSNRIFSQNLSRWLLGKAVSREARPSLNRPRPVVMTALQQQMMQGGLLFGYPLSWLLLGALVRRLRGQT